MKALKTNFGRYFKMILYIYTECHRRNGPNFGRVFLMLTIPI